MVLSREALAQLSLKPSQTFLGGKKNKKTCTDMKNKCPLIHHPSTEINLKESNNSRIPLSEYRANVTVTERSRGTIKKYSNYSIAS